VRLARAGKQVVLVERGELGGTCLNTGCHADQDDDRQRARPPTVARTAGGWESAPGTVSVDLSAVVDRKDGIVVKGREKLEKRVRDAGES